MEKIDCFMSDSRDYNDKFFEHGGSEYGKQ